MCREGSCVYRGELCVEGGAVCVGGGSVERRGVRRDGGFGYRDTVGE